MPPWFSRSELDFFQIFNFVNATDFLAQFVILKKCADEPIDIHQNVNSKDFLAQFVILMLQISQLSSWFSKVSWTY